MQAASGVQEQDDVVPEHGEGADGEQPGQGEGEKQAEAEKPLQEEEGSMQLLQDSALHLQLQL